MRKSTWRLLLGLCNRTVLEDVAVDEESGTVWAYVRPKRPKKRRCGVCGRRAPREDAGSGRPRCWRGLDLGAVKVFLVAEAPRVRCREHGRVVAQVPWARHGARHTRAFEDQVAWLVTQASRSAAAELMRTTFRAVDAMVVRVVADIDARVDRLAGLRRIGIDEISYKRGHKYLTVVVCHDSRRLVWAAPGRDEDTLRGFFDALGSERCKEITHVSADAAEWVAKVVAERCPHAVQCADPFHVVKWATEALDEVRRKTWNSAEGRRRGKPATGRAKTLKRYRWALWKRPEKLSERQWEQLAWIADTHPELHRAWRLKEGLRLVFQVKGEEGKQALDAWLAWASRCRIPAFVELGRKIRRHRATIDAALEHGLSQGLIESTNTKLRVLTRIAFGFHSPQPLIALGMLALGGHRPVLPARHAA